MEASTRVRAAFLEAILAYVEDATGRSAATGRDPDRAPRRTLDLDGIAALLETGARMLDDDAVGLHFATGFDFGALGAFSYAVLHAPSFGTAVRNMARYSDALAVDMPLHLEVEAPTATLHFPSWGHGAPIALRHLDEAAVLFVLRMLRRIAGPGWSPRSIGFRHPAPHDLSPHRRLFDAPVVFDQPSSWIRFAASDLDRPVLNVDRFRLPIIERHIQDVLSKGADADPWRHALELQIASLVCDGHPSLRTIAPRLGMSARTLQRRLDQRGLVYRDLLADVRMRIARHYLEQPELEQPEPSLGEIAFLLGYSELSAFDRAFRRWTGVSPGAYRREHRRTT